MLDLYKDWGEPNKKQGDHSSKHNDLGNLDNAMHNYNLHSRTAHRSKVKHDKEIKIKIVAIDESTC